MTVRWVTASLDVPADSAPAATEFWGQVTASRPSEPSGLSMPSPCVTLRPADGDAYLRVRASWDGRASCRIDLHVDDVPGMTVRAAALGGVVTETADGLVVLRSPGGMSFGLVRHRDEAVRPAPVAWPSGHRSFVDQVCLDIPPERYEVEAVFWAGLTDWEQRSGVRPEFQYLVRPDGIPLRLLLQRLDDSTEHMAAHLDLACDDVDAEVRRHMGLGARLVRRMPDWVTLCDPAGLAYCVTRRDPGTGRLG